MSRRPRPLAGGHEPRLGGDRQRDGAAVEHDDDGRHAGPEVRVLLHAEQPDVDAPQDLLRPWPVGREPLGQLRQAPAAPVPPNLPVPAISGQNSRIGSPMRSRFASSKLLVQRLQLTNFMRFSEGRRPVTISRTSTP
jgi:hypothetical protein